MEKLDKNKDKSEREKEIETRIVRDNPNPISMGNGVHREESYLSKKEANDDILQRAKK